ncbi:hypothetical protein E2C01_055509 [Portunus trituberculatus]|uniref:Uncharacterized protein n=1 Tax=Portunus trituberculatus TaxID=210409 RepID=A0A5B7GW50_PORTR|nr:hypothetical protein [Portunus trituberculatus]
MVATIAPLIPAVIFTVRPAGYSRSPLGSPGYSSIFDP